jgi:hypothetical protein
MKTQGHMLIDCNDEAPSATYWKRYWKKGREDIPYIIGLDRFKGRLLMYLQGTI